MGETRSVGGRSVTFIFFFFFKESNCDFFSCCCCCRYFSSTSSRYLLLIVLYIKEDRAAPTSTWHFAFFSLSLNGVTTALRRRKVMKLNFVRVRNVFSSSGWGWGPISNEKSPLIMTPGRRRMAPSLEGVASVANVAFLRPVNFQTDRLWLALTLMHFYGGACGHFSSCCCLVDSCPSTVYYSITSCLDARVYK